MHSFSWYFSMIRLSKERSGRFPLAVCILFIVTGCTQLTNSLRLLEDEVTAPQKH